MRMPLRPPEWTPPPWKVRLLLCVLLSLSSLYDAVATLELLARGRWEEGNPLVAPAIEWSPTYFLLWKALAPLAVGLLLCAWSARFRVIWWLLLLSVAAYYLLACVQTYLLYFFVPP